MKKFILILLLTVSFCLTNQTAGAQCSICTKSAQQLGEGPARGMNTGIIYLAFTPFIIVGFVVFRWKKQNSHTGQ